ncbi:unnamed protein product [Zymoseptoria tritici ST99CH_3D7]|uniref:Uncharacterized protein n=1 Tax=Zymoseptoria tritici (strain ST99CH_3D7) TaxID=1276538 RepID=A0A1X7REK7_ZYMT9|nr:unnamed protein product [Zymoseptoria tritici ST99CH_3D7]
MIQHSTAWVRCGTSSSTTPPTASTHLPIRSPSSPPSTAEILIITIDRLASSRASLSRTASSLLCVESESVQRGRPSASHPVQQLASLRFVEPSRIFHGPPGFCPIVVEALARSLLASKALLDDREQSGAYETRTFTPSPVLVHHCNLILKAPFGDLSITPSLNQNWSRLLFKTVHSFRSNNQLITIITTNNIPPGTTLF